MVIYAKSVTPRLQHVAAWFGNYLFGQPLQIVTNEELLQNNNCVLNYSAKLLPFPCFHLQPHPLLFDTGVQPQLITLHQHSGYTCFFETKGDFSFDILAASFYLTQRYEEYLPHQKDKYGRYAHINSLAYQSSFLHLPLIDIWMEDFKKVLQEKFGSSIAFAKRQFQFIPTYDVDIAYSYKGKGLLRNIGGLLRSLYQFQLPAFIKGIGVVMTSKNDPFDIYEETDALHRQYKLNPVYFFLLAQQQRALDKNINPQSRVYKKLIKTITAQYKTGIHLSSAAQNNEAQMLVEKRLLEETSHTTIIANRNHYLLFHMPHTYHILQKKPLLINEEFSMGYGTINGFRASTCIPYCWYNLQAEESTDLQVFPFCFMEATSIFQLQHSPQQALQEAKQLCEIVKQVNGLFITIFHNHLIGKDVSGRQWMGMYRQLVEAMQSSA